MENPQPPPIGHLHDAGFPVVIGGNLGNALHEDPGEMYLVLVIIHQLETTITAPSISIFMNITPDHLDRHGGMNGYIAAKSLILERLINPALLSLGQR